MYCSMRIKKDTHKKLLLVKARLIERKGGNVSFDDVIKYLLEKEEVK